MFKVIVTEAVISKGYDGANALRYGENNESVRFRIGKKVYDSRQESNYRWINIGVKAFGNNCERIKKMQLKEGSYINLIGRYDEDQWETNEGVKKTAAVIIMDEIEYCFNGNQKNNDEKSTPKEKEEIKEKEDPKKQEQSDNFEGYTPYDSSYNSYFPI